MRLLIATPAINGQFCGDYIGALLLTLQQCERSRIEVEWYFVRGVSEISRGRDGVAAYAVRNNYDKVLFIDADESWQAEDVMRLLRSDKQIVGGTYAKKEHPINLNFGCLPQHLSYFPGGLKTPEAYATWAEKEANAEGECEVAFLPAGFLLIDCSVFARMSEFAPKYLTKDSATGREITAREYFPIGVIDERKDTEDWGFCRFARSCGIPVWLQTKSVVSHWGTFRYGL